jgi:hypothetical protein
VFLATNYYLEDLVALPHRFDFGIFLFEQDDMVQSRDLSLFAPRDNVVFELGLFMSVLGRRRAVVVRPREGVKVLSDLSGLESFTYVEPADVAELRQNYAKATGATSKALGDGIRSRLRSALEPTIEKLRTHIQTTDIPSIPANAVAGPRDVMAAGADLEDMIARGPRPLVVRHFALDLGEAWGILANRMLHPDGVLVNVNWRCLVIDPDSPAIQAVDSESVSASTARDRIEKLKAFMTRHTDVLRQRNLTLECRAYSTPPAMHGFHVEGTGLLWSMCDVEGGRLAGYRTPYWRFAQSASDVANHPVRSFANWFDEWWKTARVIWPE